ncbi:MAG: nucleoside recognition protein [Lachnospiraceae bacterium]|jgi:spore maturation protein A|nr:nucleoside recognition protein [Lachnospiraceae bacterium]
MLNYLWGFMILAGILWGAANNSLDAVTQGLLDSAGEAVKLCITMAGVMSFWCGILEVGNRSGLIEWLADKMEPILTFLFPDLGKDHPARLPISVNMAANMLGLGMAATPAGLEAMKLMQEGKQSKATNAMCTFLIINISSLQLVPVTMIAYRSQYGSSDPTAVLGPALIATGCSTLAAVIFCKLMDLGKAVKEK